MGNIAHFESDIEDYPLDDLKLDSSKSIDGWSIVEEGSWTQGSVYLHVEVDLSPNRCIDWLTQGGAQRCDCRLLLGRALVVRCPIES